MPHEHDIKTFNELSEKYLSWVIKYCSATFDSPLFLVWYTDTDENSTDRLLTYKSGEIFAVKALTNLKAVLLSSVGQLTEFKNLGSWLDGFNDLEVTESGTYELVSICKELDNNNLDIKTLEGFANFVNLYGDFVNQDERNIPLKVHADNEFIQETWNYYYEYIFWPRFNDKAKFEVWERPPLRIATQELLARLNDLIKAFDDRIKLPKRLYTQKK